MSTPRDKVLFCANITYHIKAFHLPYLQWFRDQGYEVHVATGDDDELPECDVKHAIAMTRSPFNLGNLSGLKQLKGIIDRECFRAIHCHTPMGGAVARLAARDARRRGTRVLYTAHGFHFYSGAPWLNWMLYYPVEKWLSRYADCLITINQEDYDRALRQRFRSGEIRKIDGMGVALERFSPVGAEGKKALRSRFGYRENEFILAYVAEISRRKNQEFLLRVAALLRREMTDLRILIIGPDSLAGKCQELVAKLGLGEWVTFLGRRDDVNTLLGLADLYVSTRRQEGQGINIIEGMAAGLPVCATKIRGHNDLIVDGENGFLVELDDAVGFARRIATLRENKGMANEMVKNAFGRISRYAKAKIFEDICAIYRAHGLARHN